jgi:hypothetical protein
VYRATEVIMPTKHVLAEPILAYPCWAIYGDYDAEAPDTADLIWCATEELAKEVCALLNKDPRAHNDLCYVDGWEFKKSFRYHSVLLLSKSKIATTIEELEEFLIEDN